VTSTRASSPNHRVLALAGPTAVGKTEVAVLLAEKLIGEIISVDSMQVYRGLDVGTAKPSQEDRARVPHHLVDVVEVTSAFDAAKFLSLANQAVEVIRSRGRLPILCGGTGLYFKAFFEGLGEAPAGAPGLRAVLEATPISELLHELSERDPVTYERIDRRNARRVIRALEVIRMTGKPYSLQRAGWSRPSEELDRVPIFGLLRSAGDLSQRIEARVDAMFRQGLVSETEELLKSGLAENRTALQALGYRQVAEYLQGVRSLPETVVLVKTRTWQFAKRQMTWFRRQLPVRWIQVGPELSADQIAAKVCREFITTFGV
jgi:tRNA dimethylallyltransferase